MKSAIIIEGYFEGLMRSLSPEQRHEIRKNLYLYEYATFHVSVFNAGHVVTITFADEPEEFDPETWNGYDVNISVDDAVTLLNRYDL